MTSPLQRRRRRSRLALIPKIAQIGTIHVAQPKESFESTLKEEVSKKPERKVKNTSRKQSKDSSKQPKKRSSRSFSKRK